MILIFWTICFQDIAVPMCVNYFSAGAPWRGDLEILPIHAWAIIHSILPAWPTLQGSIQPNQLNSRKDELLKRLRDESHSSGSSLTQSRSPSTHQEYKSVHQEAEIVIHCQGCREERKGRSLESLETTTGWTWATQILKNYTHMCRWQWLYPFLG